MDDFKGAHYLRRDLEYFGLVYFALKSLKTYQVLVEIFAISGHHKIAHQLAICILVEVLDH